jgi:hypothetical protein
VIQEIIFTGLLFVISYFLVALIRGEVRRKNIKKYHYDYYYDHPEDFNQRLWHNFKHVISKGSTLLISIIMTTMEAYVFVF